MLLTIIAFIVAILLLVSLHELGHLIVARLCGVKVLRFSIGFGKPFFCLKRADIEWCLAPIPLGGYVKMVDTVWLNKVVLRLVLVFSRKIVSIMSTASL